MSADAYELLALTARYIFAALMVLIVLRAARGALVDSRRAAKLRRLSPMTGISGELVVLDPLPKLPRGMRFPVIREGMIGTSHRADVRIRHSSVRRRHALFQLTEAGLHIRTHASSRIRDAVGNPARELTLLDGDTFTLGGVRLLLVLSVPDLPRKPVRTSYVRDDEPDDELFDFDAWEDMRSVNSDPISPIFDSPAPDPYDDEPLYARSREERAKQLRRSEPRPAPRSGEDEISPIFNPAPKSAPDPWAAPRRQKKREFLSDDDLFNVNDDKF